MADALHTVIESDRTVYARHVVNRLQDEEAVILASEHWRDDKALPLPAQMFRMGAELAAEKTDGFRYAPGRPRITMPRPLSAPGTSLNAYLGRRVVEPHLT